MVRTAAFFVLFALACATPAEVSLGVNLNMDVTRDHETHDNPDESEEYSTDFGFLFEPSLIIAPSPRLEIVPSVGLRTHVWKRTVVDPDGREHESDHADVAGGAGCGAFFRVVDGLPFRFSLGPDVSLWLSDSGDDLTFGVGGRVNLDFMLASRFFIRMSPRLAFIGYSKQWRGDWSTSQWTLLDLRTMWTPSLGFYFILDG